MAIPKTRPGASPTFTPQDPRISVPVVLRRHSWVLCIALVGGGAFVGFSYLSTSELFFSCVFAFLIFFPGIAYEVFRVRKAEIYRDRIVFKRFIGKMVVDLSSATRVVVCDKYVWGGDWHLMRQINASRKITRHRIEEPINLRSWNYKPGVFYVDQDGTPLAMILARSYKDWQQVLFALPPNASVEHVKDKFHPDSDFWHSITPARESFVGGVFKFGCLYGIFIFAVLIATPIAYYHLGQWLGW